MVDAFVAQFGDVNQTFQVTGQVQLGKSAEVGQAGNFAFHQLTDLQFFDLFVPGICLKCAQGESNTASVTVDTDDFHLYFFANF